MQSSPELMRAKSEAQALGSRMLSIMKASESLLHKQFFLIKKKGFSLSFKIVSKMRLQACHNPARRPNLQSTYSVYLEKCSNILEMKFLRNFGPRYSLPSKHFATSGLKAAGKSMFAGHGSLAFSTVVLTASRFLKQDN